MNIKSIVILSVLLLAGINLKAADLSGRGPQAVLEHTQSTLDLTQKTASQVENIVTVSNPKNKNAAAAEVTPQVTAPVTDTAAETANKAAGIVPAVADTVKKDAATVTSAATAAAGAVENTVKKDLGKGQELYEQSRIKKGIDKTVIKTGEIVTETKEAVVKGIDKGEKTVQKIANPAVRDVDSQTLPPPAGR